MRALTKFDLTVAPVSWATGGRNRVLHESGAVARRRIGSVIQTVA